MKEIKEFSFETLDRYFFSEFQDTALYVEINQVHFSHLLSKETVWKNEKEWRLLGNAGENLPAPPIKKIYLGKNMLQENKDKMIDYCSTHNIAVE